MRISINATYTAEAECSIELPVDSWADVKNWYVRWDTLHYTLDGDSWEELELNNDTADVVDWRRPIRVTLLDDTGKIVNE